MFFKKEVFISQNMEAFATAKKKLSETGIKFEAKIVDGGGIGRTVGSRNNILGRAGERMEYGSQYYLYVSKDCYEQAKHVLNQP